MWGLGKEASSAVNHGGLVHRERDGAATVSQLRWTWAGTQERGEVMARQLLALAVGTWEAKRRQSLTIGTW